VGANKFATSVCFIL